MSKDDTRFHNQIGHFLRSYLAPAMDSAADNGKDVHIAVFSLLEMAAIVVEREHPLNHHEEFKDYVARFMSDYEGKEIHRC